MTSRSTRPANKVSAGLLMYRRREGVAGAPVEFFLVHPGGPWFKNKDEGAWSIPKGEIEGDDASEHTARREFEEETGIAPAEQLVPLGQVRQKSGKVVHAWAFEGDLAAGQPLRSNSFTLEWPPRSGKLQQFPEIDRGEFFDLQAARRKINPAQAAFLDALLDYLSR